MTYTATPPAGFIPDADNPGWWYNPLGDAAQLSNWWEGPPEEFVPDPDTDGWYYNPNGDPNDPKSWWHDSRLPLAAPAEGSINPARDPWSLWSAAEIAGITNCSRTNVERNWPLVFAELCNVDQDSVRSQAGAIATLAIETAHVFLPINEAFWLSPEAATRYFLDTSQHAAYDGGPQYHGRGDIQLTHLSNYVKYGEALGIDLAGNPDLANDPGVAAKIFARYWKDHDCQTPANALDWTKVRRLVNGGTTGLPELVRMVNELLG